MNDGQRSGQLLQINMPMAFGSLRALYAKLHGRFPTLDEVRGMLAFCRPDWTHEHIARLVEEYASYDSGKVEKST